MGYPTIRAGLGGPLRHHVIWEIAEDAMLPLKNNIKSIWITFCRKKTTKDQLCPRAGRKQLKILDNS